MRFCYQKAIGGLQTLTQCMFVNNEATKGPVMLALDTLPPLSLQSPLLLPLPLLLLLLLLFGLLLPLPLGDARVLGATLRQLHANVRRR